MDESRCVTADRHNFTGYDRAHNYDWNLNSNPQFGDYSSPTWGGMGDFPRYKGRGSGRLMSPQICASLCWDDASEEGCVPRAKTFAVENRAVFECENCHWCWVGREAARV